VWLGQKYNATATFARHAHVLTDNVIVILPLNSELFFGATNLTIFQLKTDVSINHHSLSAVQAATGLGLVLLVREGSLQDFLDKIFVFGVSFCVFVTAELNNLVGLGFGQLLAQ